MNRPITGKKSRKSPSYTAYHSILKPISDGFKGQCYQALKEQIIVLKLQRTKKPENFWMQSTSLENWYQNYIDPKILNKHECTEY